MLLRDPAIIEAIQGAGMLRPIEHDGKWYVNIVGFHQIETMVFSSDESARWFVEDYKKVKMDIERKLSEPTEEEVRRGGVPALTDLQPPPGWPSAREKGRELD